MITKRTEVSVFGEVLFDCFPTGEQVLGGAPFNVAWHLQAFGDHPLFISRVGNDDSGKMILEEMHNRGMNTNAVQVDAEHPTGRVEVTINDGEPRYDIVADSAYDFISIDPLPVTDFEGILYHGTLGLRSHTARHTFAEITSNEGVRIFLDVNLRAPWWQRDEVFGWLYNATWAKMNEEELRLLGEPATDVRQQMAELQTSCGLEQLIVTRGGQDTLIRTANGKLHSLSPQKVARPVDTVGAGDAFSAVYIHGLLAGWPVAERLRQAQRFAGMIIGLRGATTTDPLFYKDFISSLDDRA
ncbi:carbohydrate kinase [Desulfogranum marinum]|uniref:carbohydrate kinase family protein n=1 Tax=Desulfogranum marinum TaxID=453220 RepID=UPI0029C82218|nr:carbohydrate kinase [Desulfogranum marinum]